jgi:thioredoxin reductase
MNEMRPFGHDPISITGKFAPPAERAETLVIGAGPAGTAAAIEAAKAGRRVVLVDEHPVPAGLMGLDVPYYFGGRMSGAVGNSDRMVERVLAANPALEEAFELGVDVRLGHCAWGLFVNGPGLAALPESVVGLSDGTRSWCCGFDRLVIATGARDLALFFPGCDGPGLMGAQALHSLLTAYDAFDGRRIVIMGSGDLALRSALLAAERGLEVAAIVEVEAQPRGAPELVSALERHGITILTGQVIVRAETGPLGVSAAALRPVAGGEETRIACDTICLAVGLVPSIELLDAAGLPTELRPEKGGWVPRAVEFGPVAVVGDAAGLQPNDGDPLAYRMSWMRALVEAAGLDAPACLCEEVSRADLLGVQPPRYLGERSARMSGRDLAGLAAGGPVDPDQVKRLTRAGMGPCQGRRCREQVAMLLAIGANAPLADIRLASFRAPVRPLPLGCLGDFDEPEVVRRHWDTWFGIRQQWVPYGDIGTERERAWLGLDMHL